MAHCKLQRPDIQPDTLLGAQSKAVPGKYELVSQRKGFKRYMTHALRELLRKRADVLQDREDAMAGILQVCLPIQRFHVHFSSNMALSIQPCALLLVKDVRADSAGSNALLRQSSVCN